MSNKSRPNCLGYRPVAHFTPVQSLYNRRFGTPEIPFHSVIFGLEWNCDFLACSTYKFYGPHIGILYGRYDLLDTGEETYYDLDL